MMFLMAFDLHTCLHMFTVPECAATFIGQECMLSARQKSINKCWDEIPCQVADMDVT